MGLLSTENERTPTSMSGKNILKTVLTIRDLVSFEKNNLFMPLGELNRKFVWDMPRQRLLISSIFEGIDIPKFYYGIEDMSMLSQLMNDNNNFQKTTRKEAGAVLTDYLFVEGEPESVLILDSTQRTLSLLRYVNGNIRTLPDLIFNGRNIGKLKFSELPADVREAFLDYEIEVTFFFGAKDEQIEYFHRLNYGMPLNTVEFANAYNTVINDWIREKTNSTNPTVLPVFAVGSDNKSKLLRMLNARGMKFQTCLSKCIAYSANRRGIFEHNSVGKDALISLSKSTWPNLTSVPVLDVQNETVNLTGEVEEIFGHIANIVKSPKGGVKLENITDGLLLNLYMFLWGCLNRARTNNEKLEIDYLQFAKEFFPVHVSMYDKKSSGYRREYEENTRRGVHGSELKTRMDILNHALNGRNLGIKYS
jgi:hypothetical protein